MKFNKISRYRIYNQNQIQFLTLTIIGWVDIFSRQSYRDIVIQSLIYCQKHKGLEIYDFVIMSNHLHLLVRAKEGFELSSTIRDFKRHTSSQIILEVKEGIESRRFWLLILFRWAGQENRKKQRYQIWKNDNHPIEIYTSRVFYQKRNYIHHNPVGAGIVDDAKHYRYSSAYRSTDGKALLDLDTLVGV